MPSYVDTAHTLARRRAHPLAWPRFAKTCRWPSVPPRARAAPTPSNAARRPRHSPSAAKPPSARWRGPTASRRRRPRPRPAQARRTRGRATTCSPQRRPAQARRAARRSDSAGSSPRWGESAPLRAVRLSRAAVACTERLSRAAVRRSPALPARFFNVHQTGLAEKARKLKPRPLARLSLARRALFKTPKVKDPGSLLSLRSRALQSSLLAWRRGGWA